MIFIRSIVEKQRSFFGEGKTRDVEFRKRQLKKLKLSIKNHEDEILEALGKDLNKSGFEAYITEIAMVVQEINYTMKNLSKWTRVKRVRTPLAQAISTSKIYPQPYGLTLIIAPWNYPFQLLMAPLIGAIGAGNCVVLRPSPHSANTARIIEKIIGENFDENYIAVLQGGRETNKKILEERFDYIFFTGGEAMGRVVMEAAAKNLTPLTLELGGKSPCIVDCTADIDLAAKRAVWGKLINSGQTCVAPDYFLVENAIKTRFIASMIKYIGQFYGEKPLNSSDYPKIINERHFKRLKGLMEGDIIFGGEFDEAKGKISPTILDNISWDSRIMGEEIFGPIFPIIEFEDYDSIIEEINKRPRPLALYLFTQDETNENKIIENISFGGGCINDTIIHLATPYLPFGGVGTSGMGAYHGKWTFDTFSHKKSIVKKSNLLDLPFRYPPFNMDLGLIKRIMG